MHRGNQKSSNTLCEWLLSKILLGREKQQVTYKGNPMLFFFPPILLRADLSAETLQARREWQDMFKVLKGKKYTTKISVSNKGLIEN